MPAKLLNSVVMASFILALPAADAGVDDGRAPRLSTMITITHCESPVGFGLTLAGRPAAGLSGRTKHAQSLPYTQAELLLVKIGDRLDIVHVVDGETLWGTYRSNAKFVGTGPAYHLVIDRPEGREHLLFSIADDGAGQLVWSRPGESTITECRTGAHFPAWPADLTNPLVIN